METDIPSSSNANSNEDIGNDNPEISGGEQFIPPSQRADAPLAGIIAPELEDINPKFIFNFNLSNSI